MAMTKVAELQYGGDDVWGEIDNLGGAERFRFSLRLLQRITGLSRDAIINAKHELARRKIVELTAVKGEKGCLEADILMPNPEFVVKVTPADEGYCHVEF